MYDNFYLFLLTNLTKRSELSAMFFIERFYVLIDKNYETYYLPALFLYKTVITMDTSKIISLLGDRSEYYLNHTCKTIDKSLLHLPSPTCLEDVWVYSDRNIRTLTSLQALFGHGRLAGTGYVSILPVDQDIEHGAGSSFSANPIYFDPENIVRLAIEGGCNAVASTFGILGSVARKYAHRIPFVVKLNHNELLTYPNSYNQVMFGTVKEAWNMGATAVGATIYFGSEESRRQLIEVARAFEYAHELGMATILWCYLRNGSFKKDGVDYHAAADLTGQANHLGVTIQADIIKQKLPSNNGGFPGINFGKIDKKMYTELATEHPIDLCRYQVANNYMGRVGLINSGGESHGESDLKEAVITAVINKRAGGMGLISGRKAFQRPMRDGIELLHTIQDVYLNPEITIA